MSLATTVASICQGYFRISGGGIKDLIAVYVEVGFQSSVGLFNDTESEACIQICIAVFICNLNVIVAAIHHRWKRSSEEGAAANHFIVEGGGVRSQGQQREIITIGTKRIKKPATRTGSFEDEDELALEDSYSETVLENTENQIGNPVPDDVELDSITGFDQVCQIR